MSFSKLNGGVCLTFVALMMLMASSQIAMADTTLVCTGNGLADSAIDLNEAKSIATINVSASTGYGVSQSAYSMGPFPAVFDSKTVTFDKTTAIPSGTLYDHYTIDRVTGAFVHYNSLNAPFDQATQQNKYMQQYACHVATAQF